MSRYIDANNVVDAIGLREYVLEQLTELRNIALTVCVEKRSFWDHMKQLVTTELHDEDCEKALQVINQLVHLPHYIQKWIETAVDSSERFDFFVLTKARELATNDQQKDYFWALQIRHDQLIALVSVLTSLLAQIKIWLVNGSTRLYDDAVFSGLIDLDIEEQVYLEAEKIYKERSHGRD